MKNNEKSRDKMSKVVLEQLIFVDVKLIILVSQKHMWN